MGAVAGTLGATATRDRWSREENLVDMAKLFLARRGTSLRIQGVTDSTDPDNKLYEDGSLLPNPHATLAGPMFEAWLDSDDANTTTYRTR